MDSKNNSSINQASTKKPNQQSYSIPEAATLLGVSKFTVRRYIKVGKLQATIVRGKFGPEYCITEIPPDLLRQDQIKPLEQTVDYLALITEIEKLNRELGYWRGKYEEISKLLAAPKRLPWHKRLFHRSS